MVYPVGAPPRTRTVHPVRVYILKVYLSFFSSLPRVRIGDRWTNIDNGTKPSLESGRSPKRIGPNTRPNRGKSCRSDERHPAVVSKTAGQRQPAGSKKASKSPSPKRRRPPHGAARNDGRARPLCSDISRSAASRRPDGGFDVEEELPF
jgi:hypothetical protein